MRACVIIPARYASTRFPGKPMIPLLGTPMILWVAELSARAVGQTNVYVATEDERIAQLVRSKGYGSLMTSSTAATGTDRLAEASRMIDYDIFVNVQGDEPLVDPADILRCIQLKTDNPQMVVNGFCWVGADEDPASVNIPKVVANEDNIMVYMSRNLIPGFKDSHNAPLRYKKQVCIYGFNGNDLAAYANFGRKSLLEKSEDIEILRFLEMGSQVLMYECQPGSLAVDIPEDVVNVEAVLRSRFQA